MYQFYLKGIYKTYNICDFTNFLDIKTTLQYLFYLFTYTNLLNPKNKVFIIIFTLHW